MKWFNLFLLIGGGLIVIIVSVWEFLTPSVTLRRVGSSESPLEQDGSMYLTKAESYVGRARSEANQDVTDDIVSSERLFSISCILSQNSASHISPKLLAARVIIKANPYL